LLRLASTKTTAGAGNSIVATGENALAISGTVLGFVAPVVVAVIFLLLIGWILRKIIKKLNS
jgi:phage tail tape-measure protein